MTIRTLNWCTKEQLACGEAIPTTGFICLNSSLVTNRLGLNFGFVTTTITGIRTSTNVDPCGACGWVYTLTYDDTQVVLNYVIGQNDIHDVFCSNCLIDFIQSQAGGDGGSPPPIEFIDSPTVSFTECGDFYKTVTADVIAFIPPDDNEESLGSLDFRFKDLFLAGVAHFANWLISGSAFTYTGGPSGCIINTTSDGTAGLRVTITPSNAADQNKGAFLTLDDNTAGGSANLACGTHANATVDIGYGGGVTSHARFYANSTLEFQTTNGVLLEIKNSAIESTGAGSAALGANCPAVTVGAPYKWVKMFSSDGSAVYTPVWK